jgi:hypothetical protein
MSEYNFTTSNTRTIAAGIFSIITTATSAQVANFDDSYLLESLTTSGSVRVKAADSAANAEFLQDAFEVKLSLSDCPRFIQNAFSLNITDMAKILDVSRPTAYKYLNGDIPEDSAELIDSLYTLALFWQEQTDGKSIGMELKRAHDGESLFDLLVKREYELSKNYLKSIASLINQRVERSTNTAFMGKHNNFSPDMLRKSVES